MNAVHASDAISGDLRSAKAPSFSVPKLLADVAREAKRDLPPQAFFEHLLVAATEPWGAVAAAVWMLPTGRSPEVSAQIRLSQVEFASPADDVRHRRLLLVIARDGRPAAVPPSPAPSIDEPFERADEAASAAPEAANPTPWVLLISPLREGDDVVAVAEVFLPSTIDPVAQRDGLRTLAQLCELGGDYLNRRCARETRVRQAAWEKLDAFHRAVHRHLDLADVSYEIANECRRLLGCDRATVVIPHRRRRGRVLAISGQEHFDRRSPSVRRLQELASAVMQSRSPLWQGKDLADSHAIGPAESKQAAAQSAGLGPDSAVAAPSDVELPPQLQTPLHAYLDETHARQVAVLPLYAPRLPRPADAAADAATARETLDENLPIGALVLEHLEHGRLPEGFRDQAPAVAEEASLALHNALRHQRIFLLPLWRLLGAGWAKLQGRTRYWAAAALVALGLVIAALCCVPAEFELEARGQLAPLLRRDVFAPEAGVVQSVLVRHGEHVQAGQPLVQLRNPDLEVKLTEVRGRWSEGRAELQGVEASLLNDRSLKPIEREQLQARRRQLMQTVSSLLRQIELLEDRQQSLRILSPLSGQVITIDVEARLLQRPVERGQALLSVADPQGEWELHVRAPEDHVGYVQRAWRQAEAEGRPLRVRYLLANEPDLELAGTVREIHQRAEIHGDDGNAVLLKVAVNGREIPAPRSGASAIARVQCGRRAIGYVWLHDAWAFLQRRVFFRWL